MKLRKAKNEDIPAIYSLILSATMRGKILKRPKSDLKKTLRHFWVMEEDKKVVACCALEIYNRKLAEIRSLVVAPSQEGKGLGSRLIEQCIREAKRKRNYEVLVITDRENIFKRLGFAEQLHGQKALFLRP